MTQTAASLFSGIGGADLGLQRAGFEILWQCERDPYRQTILQRHFPTARRYPEAADVPDLLLVRRPDVLFIDPVTRAPEAFALAWPVLERLRPPLLAMHGTSIGWVAWRDRLRALGYGGAVFGLEQSITRLGFTLIKAQPFVVAWQTDEIGDDPHARLRDALPYTAPVEAEAVAPNSVVEIVELLCGFPLRWSCRCGHPTAVACHETTERVMALNQATDPALALVIGRALMALRTPTDALVPA